MESKRIHDLAENSFIATAAHNPANPLGTMASCHAAASMRDFRIHELAKYVYWWQDLVILNPKVAKKHLLPGKVRWG